jgi:hypothetical protein
MFSTSTLISSPWRKTSGGFLMAPIPGPVPVNMMVPRSSVVPCDRKEIVVATSKIISLQAMDPVGQFIINVEC